MKQIIRNIPTCFECPFLEWDYLQNGDVFQYCLNRNLDNLSIENKTVENINEIPVWCPLPDEI